MAAYFCLRLALGMIASLFVLSPARFPPRFFRVQYLTALGLLAAAGFFLREDADLFVWLAIAGSALFAFAGSVVWHVEGHGGKWLVLAGTWLGLVASLFWTRVLMTSATGFEWVMADDLVSAMVLGSITSAMLMGHSYLIAPTMTLTPLYRLLSLMGASLALRLAVAGAGLWLWTGRDGTRNLETELLLWLGIRWVLGFVGPLVLGWMAWETARIRSTQSATGILYVVVILGFLGELTSLLLLEKTGYIL